MVTKATVTSGDSSSDASAARQQHLAGHVDPGDGGQQRPGHPAAARRHADMPPFRHRFYRSLSAPRPRIVTIGRARVGVVTVDQRVEVRLLGPPHVLRDGEPGRVRHPQGDRAAGPPRGQPAAPAPRRAGRPALARRRPGAGARRAPPDPLDPPLGHRRRARRGDPRPRPAGPRRRLAGRRRRVPTAARGRRPGGRGGGVPRRPARGLRRCATRPGSRTGARPRPRRCAGS